MKRICLWVVILVSVFIPNLVLATGLQVRITNNGGTRVLEYIVDDKKLSFNDAKTKYNVNDYSNIVTEEGELYFYQGKEISEEEYNLGVDNNRADERTKMYGEYGIRVHSTEDIINNIKRLYDKRLGGEYHLIYSNNEYSLINFEEINEYISNNYLINKDTNVFKYYEHGIFNYPRFLYDHTENELIVSVYPIISIDEEEKLKEFMDTFKNEFTNKSDYEKILIAYSYLSNTISKKSDCGSNLSAYNAIIERNAGCVGKANAFSYIMENLGIESYIANNAISNEDSVISTHTFNIVKLNDRYYIVDLTLDGYNGLLKTNDDNIVFSNGITISEEPYIKDYLTVNIDYKKYDSLIDNIKRDIKQKESLDKKDKELKSVDFISYLTLIIILLVITIIIIIFTRKK